MRQTLLITFILLLLCGIPNYGNAQGCVAIHSAGLRACLTKKLPFKREHIKTETQHLQIILLTLDIQ
jgi:hypothetical protein